MNRSVPPAGAVTRAVMTGPATVTTGSKAARRYCRDHGRPGPGRRPRRRGPHQSSLGRRFGPRPRANGLPRRRPRGGVARPVVRSERPGVRKRIRTPRPLRKSPSLPDRRGGKRGRSFRRTSDVHPGASSRTARPFITVCLARQSTLCNGITTFTVDCWRNLPRGYVTRRSTRPGRRPNVWPPGPAPRRSPALGAGLAALPDRDPGWPSWPTPHLQTQTSASTAPRATSPARSPTSPGPGWRSSLPTQPLPSRTAPNVLATSTPASSRPSASCTRPWHATPDDLASLPAHIQSARVAGGVAGWCRRFRGAAADRSWRSVGHCCVWPEGAVGG